MKCGFHEVKEALKCLRQCVLDERALLTCMAYVDLNPIRASMAKALGDSQYTSIKERIEDKASWLSGFGQGLNDLPYYLSSYIDLVDETERVIRDDKKGYISNKLSSALTDLDLNTYTWLDELQGFKSIGYSAVGTVTQLKEFSSKMSKKWSLGLSLTPALE